MDKTKFWLKPCPFCGCEMAIDSVPVCNTKVTMYFLAGKQEHAMDCMIGAFATPRSYDKDMLVNLWNRRAEHE